MKVKDGAQTFLAKPTDRKEKSIEDILARNSIRAKVVHSRKGVITLKPLQKTAPVKKAKPIARRKVRA